jgi:hypothetical protein
MTTYEAEIVVEDGYDERAVARDVQRHIEELPGVTDVVIAWE